MAQSERPAVPRLTKEQQRRGLQLLAELERFRDDLTVRHGKLTPASRELLNQSRDEHTRDLLGAGEEREEARAKQ